MNSNPEVLMIVYNIHTQSSSLGLRPSCNRYINTEIRFGSRLCFRLQGRST